MKFYYVSSSVRGTGLIPLLICWALLSFSPKVFAQQGSLPCNQVTPWIPNTFNSLAVDWDSPGGACWDGDGILCIIPGSHAPSMVIDTDINTFATGEIVVGGSLILSVTDNANTYNAGNFVGFVVSSGLLNLEALSSITLRTYNNNVLQQTFQAFDLIGLDSDLFSGQFTVGFVTTTVYDEVEIEFESGLAIGLYNVHYAVMEAFCAGDTLECNVQTPMNSPAYPMIIDYANTGSAGVNIGVVDNPENAISASTSDFATLTNVANVVGSINIAIAEQVIDYPAGTFVGFDIANAVVLGAGLLNNVTITTYLNGNQTGSATGGGLLISGTALSSGRQIVGLVTDTPVDKIKLTISQPVGLNLGATLVYNAVFQDFCPGVPLPCNENATITNPDHPVYIDGALTGITGTACANCDVRNTGNLIDSDPDDAAQIILVAGVGTTGSIAVKNQLDTYSANTFVGFQIENPVLVDANVLAGITIRTYLDGVEQEVQTSSGALITVGTDLLGNPGEQIVGFVTEEPFDEARISLTNPVSLNLGTTLVYALIIKEFCEAEIVCDSTYFLTNPDMPVYIDSDLTGSSGIACVDCEVEDAHAVITESATDFATISTIGVALAATSLAVRDALYVYPEGTFAGFTIENVGLVLEAELLGTITISTYLDGDLQEFATGGDLIDLAALILYINYGSGVYNVGFVATEPFDEIRITVGSVVGVLNVVDVYAAFVRTHGSSGGELNCCLVSAGANQNGICAGDIVTLTGTNPITGNWTAQSGNPSGASLGTTTAGQADVAFAQAASGQYNFIYTKVAGCTDTTSVAVANCPPDAVNDAASTDEDDSVIIDVLANDSDPERTTALPSITDQPSNGEVVVNGDSTITYIPDPGFSGIDTFAYQICDQGNPVLCDQAIVIINVAAINDGPNATNDNISTDEDTDVIIDVLANDDDEDSALGIPSIEDGPTHGDVSVNPADSTVVYSPDPNFVGQDTFTYEICDPAEPVLCDIATVIVIVDPVRDTIMQTIPEDGTLTLCGNDLTTFNAPATSISICNTPANGDVSTTGACATYMPDPNFSGTDQLCLVVCDPNNNLVCDTTIVIITVTPVNDKPLAVNDNATTDEDEAVTIDVLDNDSDSDSPLGAPNVLTQPANGTVTYNPVDSSFTYTPDADFNGNDAFTYTICDNGIPPLCDTATVFVAVGALSDTIPCNVKVPFVLNTYPVKVEWSSPGLACWEGDFLCIGNDEPENVIDPNLGNFATGEIVGVGELTLSVTDTLNTYPAGYFAGFVISSGLLSAGLFDGITITTYNDNFFQEDFDAVDLVGLSADFLSSPIEIGFVSTLPFDEIEITIDNALGVGFYNVHYAIIQRFCEGDTLLCNVETAMNNPEYPTTVDYAETGSDGVSVGTVDDPENVVSASTADYAQLINVASVLGSTFIAVEEQIVDYPAGTFVGFDIENLTLTGAGVLNYITITSYLDDDQQEVVSGEDLLAGAPLLSGDGRHTVGFVTTTMVDKVKITVEQPVGVTLGTTRVYSAIFQKLCEGPALDCNVQTAISKPDYPVFIDMEHTGFDGGACVDCIIINEGNVIDNDADTYAQIEITAGALATGSLAVKKGLADLTANMFVGFRIENPNLAVVEALTGVTVTTYLNGTQVESVTNTGSLVTVNSDLLVNDDQRIVGFVTSAPFDAVQISLVNVGMVNVGTTRVYEMILGQFCPTVIACDTVYFPSVPTFPVYINDQRTGFDGVACVGCAVEDEQNVITPDTSDYAEITVLANVLDMGSISVADALYTYPEGTTVGFVIEDFGPIIEADLFEYLTITTYLDGEVQEQKSGGDLLDIGLLILFISADEGRYNVGFQTTLPFDEVRISVGALLNAINYIRVYSAFYDTNSSNGGTLFCNDPPIAMPDWEVTPGNTPVDVEILENDSDEDDPIGIPEILEGPDNGTAEVNPDSTLTYTPDQNFVGNDTLIYEICDPWGACDTTEVVITVLPVIDTIEVTIPEDSMYTVCADEITTFTEPASDIQICDEPTNGQLDVTETCVTYFPDPGFIGVDTFCVYVCHPDDPLLCDTTIIIITVTPVNDPPVAVDDAETTDEDTPVVIDVLDNDSDPDDPLGEPDVIDDPANGTVIVNGDSTITYTPDDNFVGQDTFTYVICDPEPLCDTATVIITVLPVIDTLEETIPEDSTFTVCADELTTFTEPANNLSICDLPSNGTAVITGDCVTYDPNVDFIGVDTFCVYTCHPDNPLLCDTTIIIITVTPVNDPPVAVDDEETTDEDTPVVIDVLDNDSDPDDPLDEPDVIDDPANGTITVNGDSTITYTPDDNFVGQDTFTYAICDPEPLCDTAIVIITVLPVIDTLEETIPEDSTFTVCADELTTFTEPANNLSICDLPSNGTAVITGDCVTYDPNVGFIGVDTFCVYTCHPDNPLLCDTTIIIITVTPDNAPPVAVNDAATTPEDTPVIIDVLVNDSDPDDPLGVPDVIDDPSNGVVIVNADSTITYIPNPNFNGADTFTYRICDPGGLCDTAIVIITITPVNDVPVANNDMETMDEDSVLNSTVVPNDIPSGDGGNEWDTVGVNGGASNGMVVVNDDGTYTYTPDDDFNGVDMFTYQVCDIDGDCDTAIVTITVVPTCENLTLRVFLQGPYSASSGVMSTWLNQFHILPGQDPMESIFEPAHDASPTPIGQPYDTIPWNHLGLEGHGYGDASTNPGSIPYPSTVTDWVLVSLRTNTTTPTTVWKCAGLLHNDGDVEFPSACPCLDITSAEDYHVLVEHRNHLAVLSNEVTLANSNLIMDLTVQDGWEFGTGSPQEVSQRQVGSVFMMYGGNGRQNTTAARRDINSSDKTVWFNSNSILFTYLYGDHSMNGDVNSSDKTIWFNNNSFFNLIPY
jgi:hypothetical protein